MSRTASRVAATGLGATRFGVALAVSSLLPGLAWPSVEVPRTTVSRVDEPPVLDGRLDDPAWAAAELLGSLTQVEPAQGAAPTERTEIRIVTDGESLYLGFRCYDAEPGQIIAQKMLRDDSLQSEDRISIAIDTYHDRRNGYFFQLNALGTRRDGLIENGELDTEWDGIWNAKARIDGQGWTLEVRLPFKTLSFDPQNDTWGLNILRAIRRRSELLRWADPDPNKSFINMSSAGRLEGMTDLRQGWGLDVVPTSTLRHVNDGTDGRSFTKFDPGLDVFYKFAPSLTGALTINTDFGEAEVDEVQINLSRFELFFPEQRAFFLQDSGIFDFGGLDLNGRPFFSRRIGLTASGDPVPLRAGTKVTGRLGPVNLGVLAVRTGAKSGVEAKNLAVGRLAVNVLEESQLGLIGTVGDPNTNRDNALAGADFLYQNSRIREGRVLVGRLWFQQSFSEGIHHDQAAYGALLEYPNDLVNWRLEMSEIQKNFAPALGFVNRDDIRSYEGLLRLRVRPERVIRTADVSLSGILTTDLNGRLESVDAALTLIDLENRLGDGIALSIRRRFERLEVPFPIFDSTVTVPAGGHGWNRFELELQSAEARSLFSTLTVSYGGFFDSRRLDVIPEITWRPSRHGLVSLGYEHRAVEGRNGGITARIARARLNLQFTPDISWNTLVQYDDVSDRIGVNSRLRWIVEPGREIFIVFNQGFVQEGGEYRRGRTEPLVKISWTFRF